MFHVAGQYVWQIVVVSQNVIFVFSVVMFCLK
jgi:hypothetical protein